MAFSFRRQVLTLAGTLLSLLGTTLALSHQSLNRSQAALQDLGEPLLQLTVVVTALDQGLLEQEVTVARLERLHGQQVTEAKALARARVQNTPSSPKVQKLAPQQSPPPSPAPVPPPVLEPTDLQPLMVQQEQVQQLLGGALALVQSYSDAEGRSTAPDGSLGIASQLQILNRDYGRLHDRSLVLLQALGTASPPELALLHRELDRDRADLRQTLGQLQSQLQHQRQEAIGQLQAPPLRLWTIFAVLGIGSWLLAWIWGIKLEIYLWDSVQRLQDARNNQQWQRRHQGQRPLHPTSLDSSGLGEGVVAVIEVSKVHGNTQANAQANTQANTQANAQDCDGVKNPGEEVKSLDLETNRQWLNSGLNSRLNLELNLWLDLWLDLWCDRLQSSLESTQGQGQSLAAHTLVTTWETGVDPDLSPATRACWLALEQSLALGVTQDQARSLSPDAVDSGHRPCLALGLAAGSWVWGEQWVAGVLRRRPVGLPVQQAQVLAESNGLYGTQILITAAVRQQAGTTIAARCVDRLWLPGGREPEPVYELLGYGGTLSPERQAWCDRFETGVQAYDQQQWAIARSAFGDCLAQCPNDRPSQRYWQRLSDRG